MSAEAPKVGKASKNTFGPPKVPLPLPDTDDIITKNAIKLAGNGANPRHRFIFENLTRHLHQFIKETDITTEEWMTAIQFLTKTGQTCTPVRQEFILLSDVLGASALVDALNNPRVGDSTESSSIGPFHTDDAGEVSLGESIASEGKGSYLFVQGRILDTKGHPISDVHIDTWQADEDGMYDIQYEDRDAPDCRGKLKSDAEGRYSFRGIVPVPYSIPGDGPVGELMEAMHRHNNRASHLHMMFEARGYANLVTALYPEEDEYLTSDSVFGVKKSLVVKLETINSDAEAKKRGFKSGPFKLLERDIVLRTEEEARAARKVITEKNLRKEFLNGV